MKTPLFKKQNCRRETNNEADEDEAGEGWEGEEEGGGEERDAEDRRGLVAAGVGRVDGHRDAEGHQPWKTNYHRDSANRKGIASDWENGGKYLIDLGIAKVDIVQWPWNKQHELEEKLYDPNCSGGDINVTSSAELCSPIRYQSKLWLGCHLSLRTANMMMCSIQIPILMMLFTLHQPTPKSHCPEMSTYYLELVFYISSNAWLW